MGIDSWCLLLLRDRFPTGKAEVGRKWNTGETHGICMCLAKAPVSFHLRRSSTLSELGTCQEHRTLEARGCVRHHWHTAVWVNWIRRKPSYILSKENVVIAEAVWRSGLEFSGELEGYRHRFIFQLADHFLFLRGRKKKNSLSSSKETKLHRDRLNCHLAAQHSTSARSSLSHRKADAGKKWDGQDQSEEPELHVQVKLSFKQVAMNYLTLYRRSL